jgi:hypothetical protein
VDVVYGLNVRHTALPALLVDQRDEHQILVLIAHINTVCLVWQAAGSW